MPEVLVDPPTLLILLPSLRVSGGVLETLRLARAVARNGVHIQILAMWKHPYEAGTAGLDIAYLSSYPAKKTRALFNYPFLLLRFFRYMRRRQRECAGATTALLLTHYSTFPCAWLIPARVQLACFNQDCEWKFLPAGMARALLRRLILRVSRRAQVITSNTYITQQYISLGVRPVAEAAIWADEFWQHPGAAAGYSVDVVMLLRKGSVKRLDLYLAFLRAAAATPDLRCAIITPEPEIFSSVQPMVTYALLKPSSETMRQLYRSSSIFLLLSDLEGFGLPPLEAMGSGCVPLCRDSGGVRCYLRGDLAANLIDPAASVSSILNRVLALLADPEKMAALSCASRQAFADGLAEALEKQRQCAITITALVSNRSGTV